MKFWIEWALAIHRAIWFPMIWASGLEQQAIEAPEFAPALVGAGKTPSLRVIEGGLRATKR
ncbi:MAG: hypothetical protein AAB092_03445 [Chloroflexota bacterium]